MGVCNECAEVFKTRGDLPAVAWTKIDRKGMKRFKVSVCRIGFGHNDIEVEAKSKKDAETMALAAAGHYSFSEQDACYELDGGAVEMKE